MIRRLVGTAALVVASLGVWCGTANAAPAVEASVPDIGYEAHVDDGAVVTTIDAGAFRLSDTEKAVEVLDNSGKRVAAVPLTIRFGDRVLPIDVDLAERSLRLTPQVPQDVVAELRSAHAPVDIARGPTDQYQRDTDALDDFISNLGYATMIGGLVFGLVLGVVGLAVGCGLFAVTLVGTPVGCLGGLMAGFGAGGLLGTIFVGGPALVILGIQYLVTINTPFVPPAERAAVPAA